MIGAFRQPNNILIWNLILIILNHIVGSGSEVLIGIANNGQQMGGRLFVVLGWRKPLLQ